MILSTCEFCGKHDEKQVRKYCAECERKIKRTPKADLRAVHLGACVKCLNYGSACSVFHDGRHDDLLRIQHDTKGTIMPHIVWK